MLKLWVTILNFVQPATVSTIFGQQDLNSHNRVTLVTVLKWIWRKLATARLSSVNQIKGLVDHWLSSRACDAMHEWKVTIRSCSQLLFITWQERWLLHEIETKPSESQLQNKFQLMHLSGRSNVWFFNAIRQLNPRPISGSQNYLAKLTKNFVALFKTVSFFCF